MPISLLRCKRITYMLRVLTLYATDEMSIYLTRCFDEGQRSPQDYTNALELFRAF